MIVELIHNPASGTYSEHRLDALSHAFQACGAQVRLGRTESDGLFDILPDCDLVCVSGGDGALQLVVASMARAKILKPLCVFPAGTVNLVARELGYSDDPEIFAREVMAGYLDKEKSRLAAPMVAFDGHPFVACLSAGPDGQAVARHDPALKKRFGGAAYGWALIRLLGNWPQFRFSLALDMSDETTDHLNCSAFYVIKARHYAGNWVLAPAARLESRHFHVLLLTRARRRDFLRFITQIALGRDPTRLDFVQCVPAYRLTMIAKDEISRSAAFQADGDTLETQPHEIRMTGQTVTYCLPLAD